MTLTAIRSFYRQVEVKAEMRRVLVSVEPRLLADTLMRALESPQVHVEVHLAAMAASERPQLDMFDVAVVMDELPAGVHADVVVRLTGAGELADGSVTTLRGTEAAPVGELPGLLKTLDRIFSSD